LEEFASYYPLLIAAARSLLGSCDEIEDIVQESYIRYATATVQQIGSLRAYLLTIVTRLCLDHLKSARRQREEPLGRQAAEIITGLEPEEEALAALERHEALARALLILEERLTPGERAVFLLHDVFACPYEEIAHLLNKSAVACRQLLHRARHRLMRPQGRFAVSAEAHHRLLKSFLAAARSGQWQSLLEDLLATEGTPGRAAAPSRQSAAVHHALTNEASLCLNGKH
jgi:RNA polymerase sigma-70 factor (ECF subfamily)